MKRILLSTFLGLIAASAAFGGGTFTWPTPPLPPDANAAATPVFPLSGWLNYFEQNLQNSRQMGKIDLIFDGDQWAITAGNYGPTGGMWKRYSKLRAFDFSSRGDTTQALLWRLQNGQVDGFHPKLIVLRIGGSNINVNTPEEIAEGIRAVVREYQKHCPEAAILLQGIFPRGEKPTDPVRAKIKSINQMISRYADGKKVIYLDLGDKLLQPDGTLSTDIMPDFLHPSAKGFQIWADAIQPVIDRFFPPATAPAASATAPKLTPSRP